MSESLNYDTRREANLIYRRFFPSIGVQGTFFVTDNTERDAIDLSLRFPGLIAYNLTTGVSYILGIGLTNSDWLVLGGDGGGGGGGGGGTPFTIYWGRAAATSLDEAGVLALANHPTVTSLTQTLSYPAVAQYIYFSVPNTKNPDQIRVSNLDLDLETASPYTNTSNGLTYALVTVSAVSYRVYRSLNILGGATTVTTH